MSASKELQLRMSEEHYLSIPDEIRTIYLTSKRTDSEFNDWGENMKDKHFAELYKKKKEVTKQLEERQYQLREEKRKK